MCTLFQEFISCTESYSSKKVTTVNNFYKCQKNAFMQGGFFSG